MCETTNNSSALKARGYFVFVVTLALKNRFRLVLQIDIFYYAINEMMFVCLNPISYYI